MNSEKGHGQQNMYLIIIDKYWYKLQGTIYYIEYRHNAN